MKKFPQTLYVKIEPDGTSHYFIATEDLTDLADLGEKTKVGVYELTETGEAIGTVEYRKK
jgi:hypothetical protein